MPEQAYGVDGHPSEPSFGQTGFPPGSAAEQALGRLGGQKPQLPIPPASSPSDIPNYSPYTSGFKSSFDWLGKFNAHPLDTLKDATAGLVAPPSEINGPFSPRHELDKLLSINPLTAPLAAYMRGESAAGPTGQLAGMGVQGAAASKLISTPVSEDAAVLAKRSIPVYGEPEPVAPSLKNKAVSYGIDQLNKIPGMPRISVPPPKAKQTFRGYMDPLQEAAYGDANPIPPRRGGPRGLNLPNVADAATEKSPRPTPMGPPSPAPVPPGMEDLPYIPKAKAVPGTFLDEKQTVYVQQIKGGKARITKERGGLLKSEWVPIR